MGDVSNKLIELIENQNGGVLAEDLGPAFSSCLVKCTDGPNPIYQLIFSSPHPEALCVGIYVDDVQMVEGVQVDNTRFEEGELIFDFQMKKDISYHDMSIYLRVGVILCVIYTAKYNRTNPTKFYPLSEWNGETLKIVCEN